MSRAALKANRAALSGCGLLAFVLLAIFMLAPASSSSAGSRGPDASASIVNGRSTSIGEWPWQVALTVSKRAAPRIPVSKRFFCGGSVLAPRLVITAGHCVADLNRRQVRRIEIISGRTSLNSNRGQVARVKSLRMPLNAAGKRRYRTIYGTADWDVALLVLATSLDAEPVKLAGPGEEAASAVGQIGWITGWGNTSGFTDRLPRKLQVARQVVMGNGLCRRDDGVAFKRSRMVCIGGPAGNTSTCLGDSGGPLVVATSAGYRLIGLTSYGDGICRATFPSVDTRLAADPIRGWVARTALALTGTDVLGSGGVPEPSPRWCKVPYLFRLRPALAQKRLEAANCRLGAVRTDPWAFGRRGRIVGASRFFGWLAPAGFRVKVWVAP